MDEVKYVSIDIGSNAMRASVFIIDSANDLEVLETFRYPLRLGEDTFLNGKISKNKFKKVENAFADLLENLKSYEIREIFAVATSAIRDAENGKDLIAHIKKEYNIEIKLINGVMEANFISSAISTHYHLENKNCLFIDVGGGSTEIILTSNNKVKYAKSFQCGTVRLLQIQKTKNPIDEIHKITDEIFSDLKSLIKEYPIEFAVGTGGNLRRMGKLRNLFFHRSPAKIFQKELLAIKQEVSKFSLEQRINFLNMRADRADVILPAMQIIVDILIRFDIPEIHLPTVGLKEGIIITEVDKKIRNILNS